MGIVIDLKERKIMSLSPLPPPASPVSLSMLVQVFTSSSNSMKTYNFPIREKHHQIRRLSSWFRISTFVEYVLFIAGGLAWLSLVRCWI